MLPLLVLIGALVMGDSLVHYGKQAPIRGIDVLLELYIIFNVSLQLPI